MKNYLIDLSQHPIHRKECTRHTFDKVLSVLMITFLSPLILINITYSLINRHPIFTHKTQTDALGCSVHIIHFTNGIFKNSAQLINIFRGELSFCGVPLTHSLSSTKQAYINRNYICNPGIFSLFDLHRRTGLAVKAPEKLLLKQLNSNGIDNVLLLLKSVVCFCLYANANKTLIDMKNISLFGLNLSNTSMEDAVNWAINESMGKKRNTDTQIGFFINVNSINICLSKPDFYRTLQQGDRLLVDGSGMRLAAKSAGYLLKDNTNGTDMLPHLCQRAIEQAKSIYFLGSKPGVAAKAALELKKRFPKLSIAGSQHGFIKADKFHEQVDKINQSGCDILLVAMGSPFQEEWLLDHKEKLHCETALAVGGLFDFYSGDIARAPLWLRELGLEWIWRLWQEPISKFKRYVIGNIFRIYVLGLASKGVK
jgi:N-acetylglucosaminyldiphosphoundecaprenol N-acetyl-beta-D-mannosaminyltransferase